ncbi:19616_t:CDS:2 [Gigaspora margarita]|uniref:19616_t:CDS:1 n=1 Tax=Gigaspora margarita TaxID=4874 RepID=A0ABN7WE54_GIGMA|nr:19616_t:CDS:2 [Gigaspora margarita]
MSRAKKLARLLPSIDEPIIDNEVSIDKQNDVSSVDSANKVRKSRSTPPLLMQPAGITATLPKIPSKFIQPADPRLLKVAVLGTPNAGKSTLLNALLGEVISVVSDKAHTTRERILAVLSEGNTQILFLDTPGTVLSNKRTRLNRGLINASWQSLVEVDHVVVDAHRAAYHSTYNESCLFDRLNDYELPVTLALNKVDLLDNNDQLLQNVYLNFKEKCHYLKDTVNISALKQQGLSLLKEQLFSYAYPQDWVYPAETKSEMADLKKVEDFVRAEFLTSLRSYLPYIIKQENVGWTVLEDGSLRIDQVIYVERESQERIVIGKKGSVIKVVTRRACKAMVAAFKRPVRLYLTVKVRNEEKIRRSM